MLNEIHGRLQTRQINYWRDKRGHEIDFVLSERQQPPIAIECKWSASDFHSSGVEAFRRQYRKGNTYVVAMDVDRSYRRSYGGTEVRFVSLAGLIKALVPVMGRSRKKKR